MKLAIVGSAGQVGQEFAKLVPTAQLIPLTRDRVDIADPHSVRRCFDELHFDVLVNLAAFHDVNGCEDDGEKAFRVNGLGACYLAQAAARKSRKVVFFSSDYVFGLDAHRKTPYVETDVVGPLSIYGASKVAGEELVRAATENHLIIRASSLFGLVTSKKGWTFPEMILKRATSGETLRVVNDQYMSPTYTFDLVKTTLALLEKNAAGTVHCANGGGCTWYEFAKTTLELAGVQHPIEPVSSDAFPAKAKRPMYSRLGSARMAALGLPEMRPWQDATRAYLIEKGVIAK